MSPAEPGRRDDRPNGPPGRYEVAVIGGGALGLTIASRLAGVCPVVVVAQDAARAGLLRHGMTVGDAPFTVDVCSADDLPVADWVVLVTKARATEEAARVALAMRPRGLLSLQNGLVEPVLRAVCGSAIAHLGQGVTTMGAYREPGRVVPVSVGETALPPGFEVLAARFAEAGFPARIDSDIAAARLAKLLVNLVLNPLTALFRVRTGELLTPPYGLYVDALVGEAWPVLRQSGLKLDQAEAHARVWAVIRSTAGNRTSMLQDVLAGRPTELPAITGAFLALADAAGAAVPTHRALHALLSVVDAAAAAPPR